MNEPNDAVLMIRLGVGEEFAIAIEQANFGVLNIFAVRFSRGIDQTDIKPAVSGSVAVAVSKEIIQIIANASSVRIGRRGCGKLREHFKESIPPPTRAWHRL